MSDVFTWMPSPVGALKLVASEAGLRAVIWEVDSPRRVPLHDPVEVTDNTILIQARRELEQYFAGQRTIFSVPLDFRGTDFQKRVWAALVAIPFGETRTYGDLAHQLGASQAMRAVGAANGRNPISIIAPCHRVIGASGKLTGFAGGLAAKAWLLDHEGAERRLL